MEFCEFLVQYIEFIVSPMHFPAWCFKVIWQNIQAIIKAEIVGLILWLANSL